MGRHHKTVVLENGLDRRSTGYYSTPAFVAEFIRDAILAINPHIRSVYDPCAGRGEMLAPFTDCGLELHGSDILDFGVDGGIHFVERDFLKFYEENRVRSILGQEIDLPFDAYVANPPYNCHEVAYIRENRPELRALFGNVGALNMYSMFIAAIIDSAKDGAVIGIITLDSFLSANGHAELRRFILDRCAIHYLVLCPTDLFLDQGADVRTCIMILQKGTCNQAVVKTANRPLCKAELERVLSRRTFHAACLDNLVLEGSRDNVEFLVGVPEEVRSAFAWPRLGTLFPCVTGISTGNDSTYLSKTQLGNFAVPFYKNPGTRRFYTEPDAFLPSDFLEIETRVPNFMVRNKNLLFRSGITCSSMGVPFSAAYLPPDSTYGVNANIVVDEVDTWWLLAYLNSHLVTFFVRGVLNRSNMVTAGYVSRIPVPHLSSAVKQELTEIARVAYERRTGPQNCEPYILAVNRALAREIHLSAGTQAQLREFATHLLKAT